MLVNRSRQTQRHAVGSPVVAGVKRVCLLGAESTGKSTLAEALAHRFETLWNPEYGRPYTQLGRPPDAPWMSAEFTHIARIHCWYEDFLAALASRVLFSDTDAFTTGVFHEVYLGTPATAFPELVDRPYDLFVVCGLDVPWRHDGIREFEAQRRWMHERYLERVRGSGSPWFLAEGPLDVRVEARGGRSTGCSGPQRRSSAERSHRRAVLRRRHEELAHLCRQTWQRSDRMDSGWWVGVPRRRSLGAGRPAPQRPIGCQTVFISMNAAISHGLLSSRARTTRLTFSAASTSSGAESPSRRSRRSR